MSRQSRPQPAMRLVCPALGAQRVALTAVARGGLRGRSDRRGFAAEQPARVSSAAATCSTFYDVPGTALPPRRLPALTLTGQKVSLAAYRGDVLVLNFWGSRCAPVPGRGTPARDAGAGACAPSGVRFLGVDIRDEPQ